MKCSWITRLACRHLQSDLPFPMRSEVTAESIQRFIRLLGQRASGAGRVYLVGGTTAVLHGWRGTTVDIDLELDPEPDGAFEAIAKLKDEIGVNVELAAPDDFLPELPGWRDRSQWIAKHGLVDFYHYDFYSQALAKLERGHPRDHSDVAAMWKAGLIQIPRLKELFAAIEAKLIRFPSVDAADLACAVEAFARECGDG